MPPTRSVSVVTLGCARNEVDSEELAGRLEAAGWRLVEDAEQADVAVVNTCGFVEQAKKDSIDTLIEAAAMRDSRAETGVRTQAVVAVGCLAERYGRELADSLPEADAVLGFDSYADLSTHLDAVLRGDAPQSHVPRDRRTLLPVSPVDRAATRMQLRELADLPDGIAPASGPRVVRRRLGDQPWAPLKLASGCDRRCTFCAIPAFRGAFVSRPPAEVLTEARWLAERGVSELFLVSENSTSYGKDLGDLRLLEGLLPKLAATDGVQRVRVSYLQPAELRPGLLEAIAATEGVAPYFDLSFQHSAPGVLRRMRRFGGTGDFLTLLKTVRDRCPEAGVRSNVIVGFPGETDEDVEELCRFLTGARLDVVGVFGYSDEDGTAAADLDGKLPADEIAARVARVGDLVEELSAQRAQDRIGEIVDVLVEGSDDDAVDDAVGGAAHGAVEGRPTATGRSAHQGPEVDGLTLLPGVEAKPGDWVRAVVVDSSGVDLIAWPLDRIGEHQG